MRVPTQASSAVERQMVTAIETAPASTSPLGLIAAALDATAVRFKEVREFAGDALAQLREIASTG